jgi:hypothetical protein
MTADARRARSRWSAVTLALVVAIFAEAIFAGAMLSSVAWGRTAHLSSAFVLIAATLAAGGVAVVTLRRTARGRKLAWLLLSLAAVLLLQTAVGRSSARGANLMWLHVPLGVALVGLASQAAAGARRLGEE